MRMSRRKPVSRETSVHPPTVKIRSIMRSLRRDCGAPGCDFVATSPIWSSALADTRLAVKGAAARRHNAVLSRLVEIGMHGQAQDFPGQLFADGEAAIANRIIAVGFLAMQRPGIINASRNPFGFESSSHRVAKPGLETDRVLRPDRSVFARHRGHGGKSGQLF